MFTPLIEYYATIWNYIQQNWEQIRKTWLNKVFFHWTVWLVIQITVHGKVAGPLWRLWDGDERKRVFYSSRSSTEKVQVEPLTVKKNPKKKKKTKVQWWAWVVSIILHKIYKQILFAMGREKKKKKPYTPLILH